MPPKGAPVAMSSTAITTSGLRDTNIADMDLQLITKGQLQKMVNYLSDNNKILKERINKISTAKVKLPLIK